MRTIHDIELDLKNLQESFLLVPEGDDDAFDWYNARLDQLIEEMKRLHLTII